MRSRSMSRNMGKSTVAMSMVAICLVAMDMVAICLVGLATACGPSTPTQTPTVAPTSPSQQSTTAPQTTNETTPTNTATQVPTQTETQTQEPTTATPTRTATASPGSPGVPDCAITTGDNGGFRFSTDGGETLSRNASSLSGVMYTWDLDVDPRDADVILQLHQGTLYRSEDAGCTFSRAAIKTLDYDRIFRSPSDPDLLVLTSVWTTTLAVSTNGGQTWNEETGPTEPYALAFDADDKWTWTIVGRGSNLYHRPGMGEKWISRPMPLPSNTSVITAAHATASPGTWLVGTSKGLVRTEDNGLNWTLPTEGLPDTLGDPAEEVLSQVVSAIDFAESNSNVAYMVLNTAALSTNERAIWRSDDGGMSWERKVVNGDFLGEVLITITGGTRVFIDPSDADHALFAFGIYIDNYGTDIFRSSDGLSSLEHANFKGFDELFAMAFGPAGSDVIYVGASTEIPN